VGWAVVVVVGGVDSCNGVETRSEAIRVFVKLLVLFCA